MKPNTFRANQKTGRRIRTIMGPNTGPCQPPKKMMVARHETVTMLAYSDMKNMANFILLYSVWNPPTNSVSPSGRSKGTRLVSAIAEVKYMKKPKGWAKTYQ